MTKILEGRWFIQHDEDGNYDGHCEIAHYVPEGYWLVRRYDYREFYVGKHVEYGAHVSTRVMSTEQVARYDLLDSINDVWEMKLSDQLTD